MIITSVGENKPITSSDVTTALGYTPYDSTNPSGYITGITSSDVTTALGYTPYNSTNPSSYQTSTQVSSTVSTKLNRTDNVNAANTSYTTVMARGIQASTTDLTAGTSTLTSGTIYLVYE